MKILHLIDIPWWSGLSAYAFDCAEAHQSMGHDVIMACETGSLPHKRAVQKHWRTIGVSGRSNLGGFLNFFRIALLLLRERPDWAVSHTGSTHWILWFWSKFFSVRVVRTRATSQKPKNTAINRMIYSGTRAIVAASEHLKSECAALLNGRSESLYALYPPVRMPIAENTVQPRDKTFGMLARLDPVKGHRDLLKAFKQVQAALPDAELRLAGSEENLKWSELLKDVEDLNLSRVTYHGFIQHHDIHRFLEECSVGIVASTGSEELSRALLEWMSCGKPVVATNVGCIPDILRDGQGGWIVPISDSKQMADRMIELMRDPSRRSAMGELNRKICRDAYSPERFAQKWEDILR